MELRHLRYFVAVAEEGSLTLAAEKRLHTAQPSLSRQIRDLEYEVGVQLMSRSVHGIELTAAGRAFLDHARLALTQAEAAAEAARRAAQPVKPTFAIGFQIGQEVDWLPRATSLLRDELPNIEIRVSSDHSTMLADNLERGKLDIAFLRRQPNSDLEYKLVAEEPLVVILPSDHPLAEREAIDPHDLADETFIGVSTVPRVLRAVIHDYLKRSGIEITPHLEIDNFAMATSLIASTRGVALLPASIELTSLDAADQRKNAVVLFKEPYVLAVSLDHRFAKLKSITLKDLNNEPFIVRTSCETFQNTTKVLLERGIRARLVYRTEHDDRALALVGAGVGVALVPALDDGPGVAKVRIPDFDATRTIGLRWQSTNRDERVDFFVAFARNHNWSPAMSLR